MEQAERLRELLERYVERSLGDDPCEPAELCRDEPELLPDLRRLVAELEKVDEALDEASWWNDATRTTFDGDGERPEIPHHRLLRKRGEGGMGEVWEALQESPVQRPVAVKVIRQGLDSRDVLARFEAERQALALMNHANIAKVFDAGATTDGRPYFAMELVNGVPITDFCDDRALSVQERLDLFARVCRAVQHAHQRGVIHRDLKPSNVLVDEEGTPKVIDFGIAKAVGEKLATATVVTQLGQFLGTPEYMSPEQANPLQLDVDVRTDVYSLGVILYEILVGVRPWAALPRGFTEEDLERRGHSAIVTPSQRLKTLGEEGIEVAARRQTAVPTLTRSLRGELDWIALKALEPDRERRYLSATELAEDLERYQRHEPIRAGPPSRMYRLRKFARRHRVGVIAASLLTLAALGTATGLAIGLARALEAEDRASREAATAEQVSQFVVDLFEVTDPAKARGDELSAREILDQGRQRLERELVDQPLVRARLLATIADIHRRLGLYEDAADLFTESLETRQRLLGREHVEVATSLMGLAKVEAETGDLRRAELRLRRALAIYEQETGADSTETGRTLHELALVVRLLGRHAEAETLELRSLAVLEHILGPRHADLAVGLDNLGSIYVKMGRFTDADSSYRRVLAIDEDTLGLDDLSVSRTLHNLAVVSSRQGHHDQAEPLLRRALAIQEKALGPDHPSVATTLQTLAGVRARQGAFAEADTLFRRALEIFTRAFGSDHPSGTAVLKNLGLSALWQGNLEAAERFLDTALAADEHRLGREHLAVIWGLNTLAEVSLESGRFVQAQQRFRDALQRGESSLNPQHPERARSIRGLGRVATAQDRDEEAEALYRRALTIQESAGSGSSPAIAGTLNYLGQALAAQGRYDEARDHLGRALAFQEQSLGPDHWEVAPTLIRMAEVDLGVGDDEAAERLLRRALDLTQKAFGPEHVQVARAHEGLARVFAERRQWATAVAHSERALAIRRHRLGETHPLTRKTRDELLALSQHTASPLEPSTSGK